MNEVKLNLMQLSGDSIIRKIRALMNDEDLVGLTLVVHRKKKCDKKDCEQQKLIKNVNSPNSQVFKDSLDLEKEKIKHLDFIRDTRMQKAKKQYSQGNYDTAIKIYHELYQECLDAQKPIPDDYIQGDRERKISNITFELANCYYQKKNYEKSIEFYKKEHPAENLKHKAMRRSNLGTIYLQLEQFQLSLKYYSDALVIYNQCQFDEIDLSNTYHNVGRVYLTERMYKHAVQYFSRAIEERKMKSPGSQLPLFESIFKLGIAHRGQGKYQQSLKSFEYALSFAERGVGELVQVLKELGVANEKLNKWQEALNIYEKLTDNLNASNEDKAYAFERAGFIIFRQFNPDKGLKVLKQAEKLYLESGSIEKSKEIRKICDTQMIV